MICKKCWRDVYYRKLSDPRKSQTEHYEDLLIERDPNPCSPEEQASNDMELCDAIDNAQREHPDEVHCSCVPLLKMRIKELKEGIKRHREDMWGVSDNEIRVGHPIDEELYHLVEE